jgi:hypothetical protein
LYIQVKRNFIELSWLPLFLNSTFEAPVTAPLSISGARRAP